MQETRVLKLRFMANNDVYVRLLSLDLLSSNWIVKLWKFEFVVSSMMRWCLCIIENSIALVQLGLFLSALTLVSYFILYSFDFCWYFLLKISDNLYQKNSEISFIVYTIFVVELWN